MDRLHAVIDRLPERAKVGAAACAIGLLLYAIGIKFLLIPLLIWLNARYVPWPQLFDSWLSRVFGGTMLMCVLLQIAATVQFLIAPQSHFVMLAFLTVLLHGLVWWLAPRAARTTAKLPLITKKDAAAGGIVLLFLMPFAPILAGHKSVEKIAEIGSLQAIDATNHFAGIAEMTEAQHFNYSPGYYYPKGFHIAAGFVQNTVFERQSDLGWRTNAVLFFSHYIILGSLLAYALTYMIFGLYTRLFATPRAVSGWRAAIMMMLCAGPAAVGLYLLPLVAHGFLNYFYVIATVIVGLLYVVELKRTARASSAKTVWDDSQLRWGVTAYLLFTFGASVSWPLLVPPLVTIGMLCMVSDGMKITDFMRGWITWRAIPLVAAFLLHCVPIYFQLAYSGADASQGINLTGDLKVFHALFLCVGLGSIIAIMYSAHINRAAKRAVHDIFLPLFAFVGLLAGMQYFMVGDIRYYVIKTSLLLELLLVALCIALIVYAYIRANDFSLTRMFLLPVAVYVGLLCLFGATANPLKEARDMFRTYSGAEKPAFLDNDMSHYIKLGSQGDVRHFNSTVLHYDAKKQKLYAHSQTAFWANMMAYDSSRGDFEALHCNGALYSNLAFGSYSDAEQQTLVTKVKDCARRAHERNLAYYIVTDAQSADMVRSVFGDVAKVVY